SRRILALVI
ncbi:putative MscS family protein.1 precursor, partial [Haemophilus influenzae]